MEGSDLFFRSVFSITTVHIHPQKKPIQNWISFRRIFFFIRIRKKNTLRCLTQTSTNNDLFEVSEMFNVFKDSLSFPLIISLWLRSVKRLCMAGGLKDYKHLGFVWICEFYPGRSREGLESSMILFPSISLPRNEQRKKNTESLTFHWILVA